MIVDRQGRLFGKVNLLDACVLVILAALIPAAIVAFRVLNVEAPKIDSIQPARSSSNEVITLTIRGENFYPPLQVRVGPLTLTPKTPADGRAISVELPAAELPPGEHDVLVTNPNGITVKSAMKFARLVKPDIEIDALVRFQMLRAEDRDVLKPGQVFQDRDGQEVARLLRLGTFQPAVERIGLGKEQFFERALADYFEVTAKLKLLAAYRGGRLLFENRPLEVNAPLTLQMPRRAITGKVLGFPSGSEVAIETYALFQAVNAEVRAALKPGQVFQDRDGQEVARLLRVGTFQPAVERIGLGKEQFFERAVPDHSDVTLKLNLLAAYRDGRLLFGDKPLEVNAPLTLQMPRRAITGKVLGFPAAQGELAAEFLTMWSQLSPGVVAQIAVGDAQQDDRGAVIAEVLDIVGERRSGTATWLAFGRGREVASGDVRRDLLVRMRLALDLGVPPIYRGSQLEEGVPFTFKTAKYEVEARRIKVEKSEQALLTGSVKVLAVDVSFENLIPTIAETVQVGDIAYSEKDSLRARVARVISRRPAPLPPGTLFPERAPERLDTRALLHVEAYAPVGSEKSYTFNGKEILINENFTLKTSRYKIVGLILGFRELPDQSRLP